MTSFGVRDRLPPVSQMTSLLKRSINTFLGGFGVQLCRANTHPLQRKAGGSSGSFPPYERLQQIGSPENYFIHDGYEHRKEYLYFDDRYNSDEWQDEVYRFAKETAQAYDLKNVLDIGCGSGFKLIKYFRDWKTIGMEVSKSYAALRRRYPERQWILGDFASAAPPNVDLVIAADVIEHLVEPNQLLDYIVQVNPQYVVISTPDRGLMRLGSHDGPPANANHIREWNMTEFHAYISSRLQILDHFHSNSAQWTQCILARPRYT